MIEEVPVLFVPCEFCQILLYCPRGRSTSKTQEVTDILLHELDRGVTVLHGQGGWSGEERQVLMCAFKQKQIVPLKALVHELDPEAFLIVCDAHEVLGQGFRRYQKHDI